MYMKEKGIRDARICFEYVLCKEARISLIVVVPGSGEGTLLLKYFTIIYHKTIWFKYSIFEKKDICKALTGLW